MVFKKSKKLRKNSRARGFQKYEFRFKTPIRKNKGKFKINYFKNYEKIREQGEIENMIFFSKTH